jgi:hypothetical protein
VQRLVVQEERDELTQPAPLALVQQMCERIAVEGLAP